MKDKKEREKPRYFLYNYPPGKFVNGGAYVELVGEYGYLLNIFGEKVRFNNKIICFGRVECLDCAKLYWKEIKDLPPASELALMIGL